MTEPTTVDLNPEVYRSAARAALLSLVEECPESAVERMVDSFAEGLRVYGLMPSAEEILGMLREIAGEVPQPDGNLGRLAGHDGDNP